MAYTTDFVGHVDIQPALNSDEVAYLERFAATRRWQRPDGPYALSTREADQVAGAHLRREYQLPATGQPTLRCEWVPLWQGRCLAYDGTERFAGVGTWLRYLVDHFLRPDAHASRSGDPRFRHFGFDHTLNGMVVGCRRDNKQLFALVVEDNRVREEILRPGDRRLRDYPPLPHEDEVDARRAERPGGHAAEGQVLPFTRPAVG